jgi:hypothetical protein
MPLAEGERLKKRRKPPTKKKAARKPARKPAKPSAPTVKSAADMGALEYKRMKLAELRGDVETARAKGRVTALCQLQRLEVQIHDEIEEALLTQGDDAAGLSSEELMGFILETLLELPQGVQDQVAATLAAVRDGSIVKLGAAPKKARAPRKAQR